jgi:hypothetical protein
MSKFRRVLAAGALIAGLGLLAFGAPAQAAPDGKLYAWEHAYFKGAYCTWEYDHMDWRYVEWIAPVHRGDCSWWYSGMDSDFNDQASSLWNNGYGGSQEDVRLFRDINYRGPSICLRNGESWADLSLGYERFSDGSNVNDQISSHYWTNC